MTDKTKAYAAIIAFIVLMAVAAYVVGVDMQGNDVPAWFRL